MSHTKLTESVLVDVWSHFYFLLFILCILLLSFFFLESIHAIWTVITTICINVWINPKHQNYQTRHKRPPIFQDRSTPICGAVLNEGFYYQIHQFSVDVFNDDNFFTTWNKIIKLIVNFLERIAWQLMRRTIYLCNFYKKKTALQCCLKTLLN